MQSKTLGKKPLADLQEGKVTLPIILLRDLASKSELRRMQEIFSLEKDEYLKSLDDLEELVRKYKTVEKSVEYARTYSLTAQDTLKASFPASKERESLENLTATLVLRMN